MVLLRIHILVLIGCIISSWNLGAQEVAYEHFRAGREVPFNTIYGHFLQDSMGYLWMGTDRGLYRYNGQQFRHYPIGEGISDEEILFFKPTTSGSLWGLNLAKQFIYLRPDGDSLQLADFSHLIEGNIHSIISILGDEIHFLAYDAEGTKAFKLKLNEDDIPASRIVSKVNANKILFYYKDSTTYELQNTSDQSYVFNVRRGKEKKEITNIYSPRAVVVRKGFTYLPNTNRLALNPVINTSMPIYLFDANPPYAFNVLEPKGYKRVNNIFDDRKGYTWVCTDNGIIVYDQAFKPLFNGRKLFAGKVINTILQDTEGAYWIGTDNDGLYYIPDLNTQFYNTSNSSLPSNNITVFCKGADGTLLGGTMAGHLLEFEADEINLLYSFGGLWQSDNPHIRGLTSFDNEIYIISNNFLPYRFQKEKKQAFPLKHSSVGGKSVNFYRDQLLLGAAGYTLLYKQDLQGLPDTLSRRRNTSLLGDRFTSNAWVGEVDGLKYYDFQQDTLFTFNDGNQNLPYFISDLEQDLQGIIWVATASNGLYGLRPDSLLYHFTTENGLLSNNCKRLTSDGAQYLWIGTDKGGNQLSLQTLELQSINRADGLLIEEVTALGRVDDQLWVGTSEGLFRLPVYRNYNSSRPPPIHITKFQVWERDSILRQHYSLAKQDNNIYIGFEGLYFRNSDKLRYRYRMLGIDSNWTEQQASMNFVRYPQLSPGDYRFEVMAINEEGLSSPPAQIAIEIRSAIWQRWWFILTAFAAMLGLSYLSFRSIYQRRAREERYKRRIEQSRAAALRSQMNPHFIFNTLNAILYYLKNNNWEDSSQYLSKFSMLMRSIFEYSKYENIPLSAEIQFLENYLALEQLRFIDRISIEKHIDPHLRESSVVVPPLLIQPLLENSFKHGLFHKDENGRLLLSIREENKQIIFVIEDNGIGRKEAAKINQRKAREKEHSSLSIVEERVALANSRQSADSPKIHLEMIDLKDDKGVALGTKCRVTISSQII